LPVEPGTIIAKRYQVVEQLGKGGMGEVFSAENTRTGRMVALKVLRAESKTKQSAIERFRREARAAGAIKSDFVTQVLDVEDDDEFGIVLVFELLEGESLVERLKRTGPIGYDEVWGIVEAVWMGLADAHAAGIIHRDLKPSNVFLEQRRSGLRVKILDFGISKLPKKISTQSLTQVGQSLGTFSFMPPEQIGKAKSVDHRADIYAATTLIYQALSGKLPYQAKNVVAMMELKNKTEPRTLGEVMKTPVDPKLEAFIARGLSREPDQRFQTAVAALEGWRRLRPEGALSVMDGDAGNAYDYIEDEPSSSELKTKVLRKPNFPPMDAVPSTLREASTTPPRSPSEAGPLSTTQPVVEPPAPAPAPALVLAPAHTLPSVARANFVSSPGAGSGEVLLRPPTTQPSSLRTTLTLVVGAIALMAVGFVTVAVVLHFLG
jgi:eukaryotic-like serine/threonine-protein kinase